jgi:ribonuclease BN (tRNA processing enzyme)
LKINVIGQWGGFPKAGEATSGYLIEQEGFKLLLECGSGVVSSLQKIADLGSIDAVLVTHYHFDHFCDIGPLQYARQIKTQLGQIDKTLPVYAPDGEFLHLMKWENYTEAVAYDETSKLQIGPFDISFMKNVHPVESYSVTIESLNKKVSFTSDTSYYDGMADFYRNSDLLICECSFYSDMDGTNAGHLNSSQAGMTAERSNAGKLLLTHLPHFGNLNDLIIQAGEHYSGEILLAEHMMEIEL